MNIPRVLGISLIAVAASIVVPGLLSAQSDEQPEVRITLLESGDIQVSGDFLLDTPSGVWSLTRVEGEQVQVSEGARVIDFGGGISVQSGAFVVDASAGRVVVGERGEASFIRMQDATISPAE